MNVKILCVSAKVLIQFSFIEFMLLCSEANMDMNKRLIV